MVHGIWLAWRGGHRFCSELLFFGFVCRQRGLPNTGILGWPWHIHWRDGLVSWDSSKHSQSLRARATLDALSGLFTRGKRNVGQSIMDRFVHSRVYLCVTRWCRTGGRHLLQRIFMAMEARTNRAVCRLCCAVSDRHRCARAPHRAWTQQETYCREYFHDHRDGRAVTRFSAVAGPVVWHELVPREWF